MSELGKRLASGFICKDRRRYSRETAKISFSTSAEQLRQTARGLSVLEGGHPCQRSHPGDFLELFEVQDNALQPEASRTDLPQSSLKVNLPGVLTCIPKGESYWRGEQGNSFNRLAYDRKDLVAGIALGCCARADDQLAELFF